MPADVGSEASAAAELPQTGPGELLRNVRNERGLSVEQVADDLHLDRRMIEALEAEQFAEIGAPVFVRGHLKAYARALRMDEGAVLDAYRAVQPDASLEPALAPRAPGGQRNISPVPWVMGAVAAVLAVALAVYVLRDESPQQASADQKPAAPPAAVPELLPPPEPAEPAAAAPAASTTTTSATAAPSRDSVAVPTAPVVEPEPAQPVAVVEPPPAEPEPVAEAPAAAEGIELEFYFREESWVEISNLERRILFGLQREGMRRQLTGKPPIQILLGNAPGVDVYLNKEPYAIPARNVNGKVARFVIDPSGQGNP